MTSTIEMTVPDIGDFGAVPVIEIPVSVGDTIALDDTVIILESDKATLEVPAEAAGRIAEILVAVGDSVSKGTPILRLETGSASATPPVTGENAPLSRTGTEGSPPRAAESGSAETSPRSLPSDPAPSATTIAEADMPEQPVTHAHASPSVRREARQLGVDIARVTGTGRKGRITREDLFAFVKAAMTTGYASGSGSGSGIGAPTLLDGLPTWPKVDYEKFGEVERMDLSRITRISGPALARNAVVIPHVTNFDEADVTDLEAFRKAVNADGGETRLSLLPFVVKAAAATLKAMPKFNASLDGSQLVLKKYVNIGVAADTPEGLVVPVVKAADAKSVTQIAAEMAALAADAREGRLKPEAMQGASFTISSLGGIGGTNFTPIINAPEVAILGMTRAAIKPCWDGTAFQPRLVQPLSLSWDHRAVDGVAAARFLVHLKTLLSDFRRISL